MFAPTLGYRTCLMKCGMQSPRAAVSPTLSHAYDIDRNGEEDIILVKRYQHK